MGWSSAGQIFDPVAQALIDHGASQELKRAVLSELITQLHAGDWDTEDESLEEFRDDALIVELFREHGITADCDDSTSPHGRGKCTRRLGHTGDHVDEDDNSWWTKS